MLRPARTAGAVRLQPLSERFPDLRVADTPVRRDPQTLRGFERLPVALQ